MLFIVSGPSGAGKGRVIKKVCENDQSLRLSVSCTTRPMQSGEIDGVDYHFISKDEFNRKIARREIAEYEEVFGTGHLYGSLREELERRDEKDVLMEIDINGSRKIQLEWKEAHAIFILPPNPEELERRIRNRARGLSEKEIAARLRTATEEIKKAHSVAKYWIENVEIAIAADSLSNIIAMLRSKEDIERKYRSWKVLDRVQEAFAAHS